MITDKVKQAREHSKSFHVALVHISSPNFPQNMPEMFQI